MDNRKNTFLASTAIMEINNHLNLLFVSAKISRWIVWKQISNKYFRFQTNHSDKLILLKLIFKFSVKKTFKQISRLG